MRLKTLRRMALTTVIGVAAIGVVGTVSGATVSANIPTEKCYGETSHMEYLFERQVETETEVPTFTNFVEKHIRTRTFTEGTEGTAAVPGNWWVWSPNNSQGPQDYTPSFPSDERGTWQGPKTNGGPSQDKTGTFQQGGGNSSWFHRSAGTPAVAGTDGSWSDYGPWTDWDGADRVEDTGQSREIWTINDAMQAKYVDAGSEQTGTTTVTTTTTETSEWQTSNVKEGWTLINERKVIDDRPQIPCPKPEPETRTAETPCAPGDESITVTEYKTDWELDDDGFTWVKQAEEVTGTSTRELTDEEKVKCAVAETTTTAPPVVTNPPPVVTDPPPVVTDPPPVVTDPPAPETTTTTLLPPPATEPPATQPPAAKTPPPSDPELPSTGRNGVGLFMRIAGILSAAGIAAWGLTLIGKGRDEELVFAEAEDRIS